MEKNILSKNLFRDLQLEEREKIVEELLKNRSFWISNNHSELSEIEAKTKAINFIFQDDVERTFEEWLSWATKESTNISIS